MTEANRREFLKQAALAAPAASAWGQQAPSDAVNVAVVGIHGRGSSHIQAFGKIPNVRIAALCDVDERLFPEAVANVEKLTGHRPDTEIDIRKLLERKDIDAVSIATPDYWHALMTIWACQAGKDVYVEKPVSFTILEGRRMVEAARKYNRVVQAGLNIRSDPETRAAIRLLHAGNLGKVYRSRMELVKPRASIGRVQESSIPKGVHWDLYLGPSPYKPFTTNRFHYGWHFFWDTSTTDVGNTGVHHLDVARWGMGKDLHPTKVHCTGGYYVWDSDQETPNFQTGSLQYDDGTIIDFEATNLCSPPSRSSNIFYASEGYMTSDKEWQAFRGTLTPRNRPEVLPSGVNERAANASFARASYTTVPIDVATERNANHFANFVNCVRSRRSRDLHCDIAEGHLSTSLAHLANISYRLGRKLTFDPKTETFPGDSEANEMLTRKYREPYVLPEKV
jgi:predicted dehydrogenase